MKKSTIITLSVLTLAVAATIFGLWLAGSSKPKTTTPPNVIVVQPPSNTMPPCPAFVAYIRELSDKVKEDTLNHFDYKDLKADTDKITQKHGPAIAACPKE